MKRILISEPLDGMLPTEAIIKGYSLTWWHPSVFNQDPVILTRHSREVYRWDYVPSMIEAWERITELELDKEG